VLALKLILLRQIASHAHVDMFDVLLVSHGVHQLLHEWEAHKAAGMLCHTNMGSGDMVSQACCMTKSCLR